MRAGMLQRQCACGQHTVAGGECAACRNNREATLQRAAISAPPVGHAPPIVHDVLRAPGQPLDANTRAFMEPRFGHDFSAVRTHTDTKAAGSARAVNALAYTVGRDVVFGAGQYAPQTSAGQRLLAHELTHVVQQRADTTTPASALMVGSASDPAEFEAHTVAGQAIGESAGAPVTVQQHATALRRFEKKERSQIANFADVLDTARDIAERSARNDRILFETFVEHAGGQSTGDVVDRALSSPRKPEVLAHRYLLTCRCGLVDMRHFYQLMYIAEFYRDISPSATREGSNRGATRKGREHELSAERTSRFAPEDTPSNALGALFGSEMDVPPSTNAFVGRLRNYLSLCTPIDFARLPVAEQTTVVDFYGNRDSSGAPTNANPTAVPAVLSISACGARRDFPFALDSEDSDKKTIQKKEPFNLTSDSDIRDWARNTSSATIGELPSWEKIRQINRLLDGAVSDQDMAAIEKICASVLSGGEMREINRAVHRREGDLFFDQDKMRFHNAVSRVP